MRFGLLCGEGPKSEGFKAALKERGHQAPLHFTYEQFLQDENAFQDLLEDVNVLRIDSPGGGYNIWKCFADHTAISTYGYDEECGQIYPQSPYVKGTNNAVKLAYELAVKHGVLCTVRPSAVKCFMDKRATHELCGSDISTPHALADINNWVELDAAMKNSDLRRVFMKLRYGSAASGVLAIEKFGSKIRVWTSVERIHTNGKTYLYNSLKIKKYLDDEARHLIDDIAAMGVHTEAWIPKLRLDNRPCDLRLLVVGGKPAHCVVRHSSSPLTNLHLGNERLSAKVVRQRLSEETWNNILTIGRKVGHFFPDHLCIGVDIAIHKDSHKPYLLEVNAFGDHLNNVTHGGLNPYAFQIQFLEKTFA